MNKKDKILAEIMYQIAQAMPAPRMDCPSVNLDRVEVYLAKKLPQILTAHDQGRPRGKPSSMPDVVMVEINDTAHEQEDQRAEFEQWKSEWNGDEPDEREHMTFEDWQRDQGHSE